MTRSRSIAFLIVMLLAAACGRAVPQRSPLEQFDFERWHATSIGSNQRIELAQRLVRRFRLVGVRTSELQARFGPYEVQRHSKLFPWPAYRLGMGQLGGLDEDSNINLVVVSRDGVVTGVWMPGTSVGESPRIAREN